MFSDEPSQKSMKILFLSAMYAFFTFSHKLGWPQAFAKGKSRGIKRVYFLLRDWLNFFGLDGLYAFGDFFLYGDLMLSTSVLLFEGGLDKFEQKLKLFALHCYERPKPAALAGSFAAAEPSSYWVLLLIHHLKPWQLVNPFDYFNSSNVYK